MPDLDPRLEACAKALAASKGQDWPVQESWQHEEHVAEARVVIDEWLKQEATDAMVGALPGRAKTDWEAYAAMCAAARREIASG